ncbi:hypothetical protein [Granulicella cerasi]|nr:hypothetical protein [Granulicella cerasi]
MLLRYSRHFAEGHGITWNVGQHPVEGATDFLYMAALGWGSRLSHLSVEVTARIFLWLSQAITAAVIFLSLRRNARVPLAFALALTVYFAIGPAYHFSDSLFGAPLYALPALLAWLVGWRMMDSGITTGKALSFSLLCLLVGLIRPDGVLLGALMLLIFLGFTRGPGKFKLFLTFAAIFAILGGAYFAWRIHYFGHPFPNPFYVKGSSGVLSQNLRSMVLAYFYFFLGILPLFGAGVFFRPARKKLLPFALLLLGWIACWAHTSLINNHYSRFEWVLYPIGIFTAGQVGIVAWAALRDRTPAVAWPAVRQVALGIGCVMVVSSLLLAKYGDEAYQDEGSVKAFALKLSPYGPKGYSMISTEAGIMPLYSDWTAMDALGLNDEYLAHHQGVITAQYIDQYKPALIIYHSYYLGPTPAPSAAFQARAVKDFDSRLYTVDYTLRQYAEANHYKLAGIFAVQTCDFHYVWVRPGLPDTDALVHLIQSDYAFQGKTGGTYNFVASDHPSDLCGTYPD